MCTVGSLCREYAYGGFTVSCVYGGSTVSRVYGRFTVSRVYGGRTVSGVYGGFTTARAEENILLVISNAWIFEEHKWIKKCQIHTISAMLVSFPRKSVRESRRTVV